MDGLLSVTAVGLCNDEEHAEYLWLRLIEVCVLTLRNAGLIGCIARECASRLREKRPRIGVNEIHGARVRRRCGLAGELRTGI